MPIHEYRCSTCGHEFEELIRREGQPVACPGCGGSALERKLSAFSARVGPTAPGPCDAAGTCPGAGSCCADGRCDFGG